MDAEPGQSDAADTAFGDTAFAETAGIGPDAIAAATQGGAANGSVPKDSAAANGASRDGAPKDRDGAPKDSVPEDGVPEDGAGRDGAAKAAKDADNKDGPGKDGPGEGTDAEDGTGPAKRKRSFWRELSVVVIAALVLTILIKAFLVQVFSIPSASMQNTLQPGDRILVNRLVYHLRGIDRGDIVVFSGDGSWGPPPPPAPSNPALRVWDDFTNLVGISAPGTDYVKRVIGLPGDHVQCCDAQGRVTVNGVPLTEGSYLYPGDQPSEMHFNVVVPQGHLWVLGDHRSDSADSRFHAASGFDGTIPENEVVGRAFLIIWPASRINDLPIPNTFQQAALTASAAAVNYGPAVGGGSAAAGVLAWRRRRTRRSRRHVT
jgi:signal peptidase I